MLLDQPVTKNQQSDDWPAVSTTANATNQQRFYRPELDVLRACAFLLVFWFHLTGYTPVIIPHTQRLFYLGRIGALGVPVFFLLSAFLITELLLREQEKTGRIHIAAFYVRRLLRIWPLYFLVLGLLALSEHVLPGSGPPGRALLPLSLFAGNWYIVRHGWIALPVDPFWTISIEEQFYIAIPLIMAKFGRKGLRLVSCALLALAYLVLAYVTGHATGSPNAQLTNSFVHFQFFAAGTLLALTLHGRLPQPAAPLRLTMALLAVSLWWVAEKQLGLHTWWPSGSIVQALEAWLLVLSGTVLLFLSVYGMPEQYLPRGVGYLGRISYGMYLLHMLILFVIFNRGRQPLLRLHLPVTVQVLAFPALALGLTVLAAHLSYRYFEQPILGLKRRFTYVATRENSSPIR